MRSVEFWSDDSRFGLRIPREIVNRMLDYCIQAQAQETGGILIGHYTQSLDCAQVTEVTGPPRDSQLGPIWFVRGVHGLQRRLRDFWRQQNDFYLGEWHFHPGNMPNPSDQDERQLALIALSTTYHCPEPLLLIVGEDQSGAWQMRVFVFPRRGNRIELRGAVHANGSNRLVANFN